MAQTQCSEIQHRMLCCAVVDGAQELQRAVQLSPDTGFEKYMYLGQLLESEEALAATQKGVELLQQVGVVAETQSAAHHAQSGCWSLQLVH